MYFHKCFRVKSQIDFEKYCEKCKKFGADKTVICPECQDYSGLIFFYFISIPFTIFKEIL